MSRRRDLKPMPQSAEHCVQGSHSPHLPSMQVFLHGSELQGCTSLLSTGSQSLPSCRGEAATTRFLRFVPPPQLQEQADQSAQSLQRQSVCTQACISQAWTSFIGPAQPLPLLWALAWTWRSRVCEPLPQGTEHRDQGDQGSSLQSMAVSAQHCPVSQGAVSLSVCLSQIPSALLGLDTLRSLNICPPLQVLSHLLHSAHCVSSQLCVGWSPQPRVSRSERGQSRPPPWGACRTLRFL
mmetsp:Transcript_88806/g.287575  ORF Transcript_88806/g.287575 Transcript_88806/m.287575 type:complete len:238 (-) Transcript_88806:53-766(-)